MQESLAVVEARLREEYRILSVDLHERGRRKWAALQARRLGHGGKGVVHRATGLAYPTIRRGLQEITSDQVVDADRVRQAGGGRKPLTERYPGLLATLEGLVESSTRGDPETVLKWTSKSTGHLHQALREQGYQISQFWEIKQNIRCSILFHLLVPGGKCETWMVRFSSLASCCNSFFHSRFRQPLLPPPSALM